MAVDTSFGSWLKTQARYAVAAAADAAIWGSSALSNTLISPLALQSDAEDEAGRQAELLGQPLAVDEHDVPGKRIDLLGRCVRIQGAGLGYDGEGQVVMVIGVDEKAGFTTLTVLVRLS